MDTESGTAVSCEVATAGLLVPASASGAWTTSTATCTNAAVAWADATVSTTCTAGEEARACAGLSAGLLRDLRTCSCSELMSISAP